MKHFFLLIIIQFATNAAFSQSTDPEIRFRYSDTISLQKDSRFAEEFLLSDGKVLAIHKEDLKTVNFYRLNADLVVEEKARHSVYERFFAGKKVSTSQFLQMGQHIYYIFSLVEGTNHELFAAEFFPESMDFSDNLTELPTDGKLLNSYTISPDGQFLALYDTSDPTGTEEVKDLSLLVLDSHLAKRGRADYPGIPTSTYMPLLLANDGTAYITTKVYDDQKGKQLYNGETNFHFEVHAFNPETAEQHTHYIDLAGCLVTPEVSADLSISPDGAVTVLFGCSRSNNNNDAFAFIRIDPSVERYQLADHIIELPLDIVNEGKENSRKLVIGNNNLLQLQTDEHIFYTSDGSAYLTAKEVHNTSVQSNHITNMYTAADVSHLYTAIYVFRFDRNGKFSDITKIPVRYEAVHFPLRLFEVNGHIKILFMDHIENIAVSRFDELKKATPDNQLAHARNYALVSITPNNGGLQKQLVTNLGDLRFELGISPYGWRRPVLNYVLDSGKYIRMNVLSGEPYQTTATIVYSISVVE